MTALRRRISKAMGGAAAALTLALAMPAAAQNSEAPVGVAVTPAPSAESIGPSQLRDFNLQGRVTRQGEQSATTPAQPANTAAATPRSGEAVPAEAAATPSAAAVSRSAGTSAGPQTSSDLGLAASNIPDDSQPVTPSLPLDVRTGTAPQPGFGEESLATSASVDPASDSLPWPWIAALVALIGGGAFVGWSRRGRRQRYADPGRMAFAGLAPEVVPDAKPFPPARPRPDPLPPRAQATPPAPRPDPVPPRAQPDAGPADGGLIVSTRLRPQLNVEFSPDRVVVTDQEVLLQFEIVIANVGSAPARDVLVEGRLFTAHIGQDQEIADFFQSPATAGDRMTSIAPLGRISLKSVARLPLAAINHFEAGGRKMFVPLVGFNILYRFGSGDGQASASFLVGRGDETDEKLAPFRIDLGPRIFRGLAARPHSIGLQAA